MAERVELPPHPSNPVCVCGCDYRHHWTQWVDGEFRGTRCEHHGGHKFQPLTFLGLGVEADETLPPGTVELKDMVDE